ncbi:CocE/NonD family hydrolase [Nocardioides sp. LMS-CY]|uniref:CocE/NonD family hydrolase n=1 Tax=Nocardioides sp. (strain LMS-CY) TaxID=2840457 RepID=UPI001C008776|nr:CocE/NonD family hydrolase [Nocardioides sp. LMS-CY]QWF21929.1 CocE/NonD family hydrolase [Nocardioides sp. LMS-CY]
MSDDAPADDRPWKRPGAAAYRKARLRGIRRPPITVTEVPDGLLVVDHDVPVTTRDGTVLRVNVHRPPDGEPRAVVLCAHPYGKDNLPTRGRRGWTIPRPYRMLRQPAPVSFSRLTGWEAPDPVWCVENGWVAVNADLRGAGTSDGTGRLLSDQEGEDVADLVEWAATQPWCNGRVATMGVSYLAISQWKAAALRPRGLRAIVVWEGFTDAYRDLLRPGGVREDGFLKIWSAGLRRTRLAYDLARESRSRPEYDEFWASLVPAVERIEVPALVCGSFSDNNLHSRGSIRGFERLGSAERHLWTHRGGKWATFYGQEARRDQRAFLRRHLDDGDDPPLPRVRLEVHESRDVSSVRAETAWPPPDAAATRLHLTTTGLSPAPATAPGSHRFAARRGGFRIGWTAPEDVEIVGPMRLRLPVEASTELTLVTGVELWRDGRYVPFEGSYGFGRDRVTTGWLRVPRREGVHEVDVELGPSATRFRAGDQLRLVVAGRWLWPRNPLTGQFPAWYPPGPRGTATLHWGPGREAYLQVPLIRA